MPLPKRVVSMPNRTSKPSGTAPAVKITTTPEALKGSTKMGGRSANYNRLKTKGIIKPGNTK